MESLKRPVEKEVAACVNELMNAAVSFHKLHLKVKGTGSYAAHKALNEIYDSLPDYADALAETYQGAAEKILDIPDSSPKKLQTVADAIAYLRTLHQMVTDLQGKLNFSEIINELDNVKSGIDQTKYKLLFLQ